MRYINRAFAIVILAFAFAATAQEAKLETTQLTDNIYVIVGAGGNVGVSVGEGGVFIIDDKVKAVTAALRAELDKITDGDVRFVFNTHWHGDHVGGNEAFGKAGAVIVAQDNVRNRMSADQFMEAMQRDVPPSPDAALPVITFIDSLRFYLNGDVIDVIHVPHAHTDGDSLVYFRESNVLHMGDTYFASGYPFIDLSSGGSIDGVTAAVERGLNLADADTQIIPGHGPVGTRESLDQYHNMLVTVMDRVHDMKAAGKSLDAVQAADVASKFDERWGGGFIDSDAFVEAIYNSLDRSH